MRTRRAWALALEPPGPQRRELNRYAAELFARSAEASCLLLPELLLLSAARSLPFPPAELPRLWEGVEGAFSLLGPGTDAGFLYLDLGGALPSLRAAARARFPDEGLLPFETGRGFFLGRRPEAGPGPAGLAGAEHRDAAGPGAGEGTPRLSWRASRLLLLEIGGDFEGLGELHWREEAGAWRPPRSRRSGGSEKGPVSR